MVVILLIIIACCLLFGASKTKEGISAIFSTILVTIIVLALIASCAA